MHWVETAAACLAATSSFLMAFFLRALEAAALVTALEGGEGGEGEEERKEGGREGGREGGGRLKKEETKGGRV